MSNALAIATVTAVFRQIIATSVDSPSSGFSGVEVVTERPPTAEVEGRQIRLFLYQVSPNAALRNNDLPTRTTRGNLIQKSTAAIDLHYLLTFYGSEMELEPQRMLGLVIRDIHAKPIVPKDLIRSVTGPMPSLMRSNLADAAEQIKFSPLSLSLEELSKLWSVFFQTPYALSVAYQASVVLIDSEETPPIPAPVLRRGGSDRGVAIALGPFPIIESIHIGALEDMAQRPRPPSYPSAQLGTVLTVSGQNLGGEVVRVRFEHVKLESSTTLVVPPAERTGTELKIKVSAATPWAAGFYTVTVLVENGGSTRASNKLPLSFSPKLQPIRSVWTGSDVMLTIAFDPVMRSTQRASLLIADREVEAEVRGDTNTLDFNIENAGRLVGVIVRLRIDGIDSLPFKREPQPVPLPPLLVFDEDQRVPTP